MAFAFAGSLAALNALADPILSSLQYLGLFGTVMSLAGVSAVVWFALFAVLRIALEPDVPETGTAAWRRADAFVLVPILALTLFPAPWPATLAVLTAGAWLMATADDGRSRRIALVLLALSGPLLWGRVILTLFAPLLLALDGHIVGALAGTQATGNTVGFVGNGAHFIIGGPCSSVHNISLAILLWSSIVALLDLRVDRPLIVIGVVAMAGMFALNIVRLTAIAYFPADFDSLHLGTGATLFSWAGLLLAGLIIGGGAMPRSTASVSLTLVLLALTAIGSIALKGAMRSAPEQELANQALRKIAARLAQQGFAVRIERHPVQNDVVLADRGPCRISARDASPGAAFATAFSQQAASVGPVRYLYRQQQFAAPPETRMMLFRLVPRTLDRLGVHLARPLPVAIATSSACPAGDFGLGAISVTP